MPANQGERRQELEQIRRSFSSLRARLESDRSEGGLPPPSGPPAQAGAGPAARQQVGSLFEPGQPATAVSPAGSPLQAPPRARPPWSLVLAVLGLAVGMALGYAVGAGGGGDPASPATTARPAAIPPAPPRARPSVSSACLETARQGDQLVALLITNQRRKASAALKAYTLVSQQCRKDAAR